MSELFIIFVLSLLLLIPIALILRAWVVQRVMGAFLACCSIVAHLVISLVLWSTHIPGLLTSYLVANSIAWIVLPNTGISADKKTRKRIREEDIARYERKIRNNPEFGAAYSALADAYMEAERYADAAAAYQKAIELDPDTTRSERWKAQRAIDLISRRDRRNTGTTVERPEPPTG